MDILFTVFLFILGSVYGSFLNVVIYRLPENKSFIAGRSYCPVCRRLLRWYDLVPLLSFLFLSGRCRYCREKISWQYPVVELASGILLAAGSNYFLAWPKAVLYLLVCGFFIVLFVLDCRKYIIPDKVSLPAIVLIAGLNILFFSTPALILLGGLAGGAWFFLQFLVSRGKWIGGGDIRLGMLIGVLLGYKLLWLCFILAYVGGSLFALSLLALGRKKLSDKLPFAAILLPASFVVWVWGGPLWQAYLHLLGF